MNIPDHIVEASARAEQRFDFPSEPWDALDPNERHAYLDEARHRLKVAYPLIVAQALRDADKSIILEQFSPTEHGSLIVVKEELRYRADELDPQ